MNEVETRSLYMEMPLCRIKFYHESGKSVMSSAGIDLWGECEEAGLTVAYRLTNPRTDIWAYPDVRGNHPGLREVSSEVRRQGYRTVPYKRLVHDLGLALCGGRELGAIYHHRPRPQPPEFIRRMIRF